MESPIPPIAARRSVAERNTLRLIGAFKLLKTALLILISIGAFRLVHRNVESVAQTVLQHLRADPDSEYFHAVLAKMARVTPERLRWLGVGTAFYAVLYLIEGVGLLMEKEWAEWVTLVSTSLFVPLEIYEVAKHMRWAQILVLVINLAIVAYLAMALRWKHRKRNRVVPA